MTDLRNGRINGVVTIPPEFSRRALAKNEPRIALIADNADNFVAATMAATLNNLETAYNAPAIRERVPPKARLDVVEVYPYVPYLQYLLPGSIVMSIFMMVMIGGRIIFIDDKARGLHEGYLVTPIKKLELIAGFNLSGPIKAVLAGTVLMTIGSVIAGIPDPFLPIRLLRFVRGDRPHFVCARQHDVFDHGANDRSAHASGDLRRLEHAAVFPERCRLSAASLSELDARHCRGRSVHLFRRRL